MNELEFELYLECTVSKSLRCTFFGELKSLCKNVQKCAKNVQKLKSQMFLYPIQKCALSRSVHLEAVFLEALLYMKQPITHFHGMISDKRLRLAEFRWGEKSRPKVNFIHV